MSQGTDAATWAARAQEARTADDPKREAQAWDRAARALRGTRPALAAYYREREAAAKEQHRAALARAKAKAKAREGVA